MHLDARWFSRSTLAVPAFVVVGSLLGAMVASWITGESLKTSFALSSGFGWFTLSSVLIGDTLGQTYGTMALMTDLFRELLAIVLLYAIGRHDPQVSIGSAGATALDSTLPIIKQACSPDAVPMALVSGFLLTILAPVFITFFLT
ncbi:lysine exporter LysO family protein [Halopseudomonas pelagia]|uniref:lysine exporter LysO family protein n=1 Tax=Halopseudomonas pelagia TaxID=553151 RepID=UPI001F1D79B7|nr:lysine exporter LysO family protein [Halopseudomonas pelagia]